MKNIGLLIRLLVVLVLFVFTAAAQDATKSPTPATSPTVAVFPTPTPTPTPVPLPHVDSMLGHLELDDIVELHVEGVEKWAETHDVNKLVPYINGRAIRGDYPDEIHLERGRVIFHLQITQASKDAWIDLLGEPTARRRPVTLSAGLENGSGFDSVYGRDNEVPLTVIPPVYGIVSILVIFVTLSLLLWLARNTNIIREPGPPSTSGRRRPYNLGRAQMAFWFFLIYASYVTIWLVTDALDTITSSLLALMGISAGTALGEALIDNGKDTSKTNQVRDLTSEKQAIEQTVTFRITSTVPVSLPLDTKRIVCMVANRRLQVRQINLTIEPLSSWDANVIVLHAQLSDARSGRTPELTRPRAVTSTLIYKSFMRNTLPRLASNDLFGGGHSKCLV